MSLGTRFGAQYLDELQKEFYLQNHTQMETVARPYAFIKFGARSLPSLGRGRRTQDPPDLSLSVRRAGC